MKKLAKIAVGVALVLAVLLYVAHYGITRNTRWYSTVVKGVTGRDNAAGNLAWQYFQARVRLVCSQIHYHYDMYAPEYIDWVSFDSSDACRKLLRPESIKYWTALNECNVSENIDGTKVQCTVDNGQTGVPPGMVERD